MVKHNLKLIFRNLWNKRVYSSVILMSLIVGFICSNILIAFLVYEGTTDRFHQNHERISQVFSDDPFQGKGRISFIPKSFTDYLNVTYPEVENICQMTNVNDAVIEKEGVSFDKFIFLATDSSFFSFFDFPLVHGNRKKCLTSGHIVLSMEKAALIFGKTDVIDEILTIRTADTTVILSVSGVVDTHSANSHLAFDALADPTILSGKWFGGLSYILLDAEANAEQLERKIGQDIQRPGFMGPGKMSYYFNPLADSYFNTANKTPFTKTRSPLFIKIVYVVCGVILFIASFNFINLFLLFSHGRKKEIGIKKTLGVTQGALLSFSFVEAVVYISLSSIIALLGTGLLLPVFNAMFESNLSAAYFFQIEVLAPIAAVLLLSGAMVVTVAVVNQWHMKPISLMAKGSTKVTFSKVLFAFQFTISIILAICSITIIQQMHHVETAPLGFNRNIIQINAPGFQMSERLQVLKQKASLLPEVNNLCVSGGSPISGNAVIRFQLDDGRSYSPFVFAGDDDFLKTLDLKLVKGELPSKNNPGKLVNETLVRQFDLSDPIGRKVPGKDDLIVGVVKDFTVASFKEQIPPVIISYYEHGTALLVDYAGNDLSRLIPQLEREWRNTFPDNFFDYRIIQVDLMKTYKDDMFLSKIVISFAIVSIVLSCFGLFALSWAVLHNRTKEIGIRKVLGATSSEIFNLLTVSFTKRIAIAFIIAVPIGYYFMDQWLRSFVNRIGLSPGIFITAALLMILVSALTLSLQTFKATMTNPVDEIRTNGE